MRVKTVSLLILGLLIILPSLKAETLEYGPSGFERYETMLTIKVDGKILPGKKVSITVDDGGKASYIMSGDLLDKELKRTFLKPLYRHPTSPTMCDVTVPEGSDEILLKIYDYNSNLLSDISCNLNMKTGNFQRLVEYKALTLGEIIGQMELSATVKSRASGKIMKVEAVRLPNEGRYMVRFEFEGGNAVTLVVTEYGLIKTIIDK
tara:strand:+ start:185 stop:802 length:618 start_codon:yes stop_codon:yes gene_type:complete